MLLTLVTAPNGYCRGGENARLYTNTRRVFLCSPETFSVKFFNCETQTSKCFNYEPETFGFSDDYASFIRKTKKKNSFRFSRVITANKKRDCKTTEIR